MKEDDIYGALTNIFHDVFMREDLVLTPSLSAKDVEGWDSFKMIEIIIALEQKFSIRLKTKDLDGLQSVGDLVKLVQSKFQQ